MYHLKTKKHLHIRARLRVRACACARACEGGSVSKKAVQAVQRYKPSADAGFGRTAYVPLYRSSGTKCRPDGCGHGIAAIQASERRTRGCQANRVDDCQSATFGKNGTTSGTAAEINCRAAGFGVPLFVPVPDQAMGSETALLLPLMPLKRTLPALDAPGRRLSTVGQLCAQGVSARIL